MRQVATAAPMTAAAFAGEAFSCARANGASCAAHTAILLDAIIMASIIVILGILSVSLLGLIGLLLITLVVLLALPRRPRDRRSRFR
ncbi:hypothetical protein KFE19_10105 [Dysosmobacter sp. Marseille-Q4140]|nr:hypothetical protein KFE19_10105 [Dysosmobacter sp. Marseille-Q4140]